MTEKRRGGERGNTRTLVAIYSCICYLFDLNKIQALFCI